MAKVQFYINADCSMDTQAEATAMAIRKFADAAEDFFRRSFSGEDTIHHAGVNLALAYLTLGKQVDSALVGFVTPGDLDY